MFSRLLVLAATGAASSCPSGTAPTGWSYGPYVNDCQASAAKYSSGNVGLTELGAGSPFDVAAIYFGDEE